MWDVTGSLIQVEVGAGVVQRYSSKGLFGASRGDGKLLLGMFTDVREKLGADGIVLPYIQCRDDSSLERDAFTVYVGSEFFSTSMKEHDHMDIKDVASPSEMAIRYDDEVPVLRDKLGQLKRLLEKHFDLEFADSAWERSRERFLSAIQSLV